MPTLFCNPIRMGSNRWISTLLSMAWTAHTLMGASLPHNHVVGEFHVLNDNGAWSWFMDERLLADAKQLIVGSARASGRFEQSDLPGWGNIELSILDFESGRKTVTVLKEQFEQDDHNNPGLLKLPNGHYLALFSKHNQETKVYFTTTTQPGNALAWNPIQSFTTPGDGRAFGGDSVTYANPIMLSGEGHRIYLFHRGIGNDPNYLISEDLGATWRYGGKLFVGRDGYSPYVKYASNGKDAIHFVATEDHPRNFDNSLYHGFIRQGRLHHSDGRTLGSLSTNANTTVKAWDFTRLFHGDADHVAWMCDIHLDAKEQPVVLFTTQRDGKDKPMGSGGMDHRFHYARWNGRAWVEREIAYAGTRLYPGEDDYTGLGAIDPQNVNVVYLSSDAHPENGRPIISRAIYRRVREIFRGETEDQGHTWKWTAVTSNSSMNNIRPIVSMERDPENRTILVWMRGGYFVNRGEWNTQVVCSLLPDL